MLEQVQPGSSADKRKKPNPQDREQPAPMDVAPPPPSSSETGRSLLKTTVSEATPTQGSQQKTQCSEIQEAVLQMSKVLTDRMDAMHNVLLNEIQNIKQDNQIAKQDIKQQMQIYAGRLDGLELGRLRKDQADNINARASRRPTPYTRDTQAERKEPTSTQDATKTQ